MSAPRRRLRADRATAAHIFVRRHVGGRTFLCDSGRHGDGGAGVKNRDQFLQALRRYGRKNRLEFNVDKTRGKGSHYVVAVGDRFTTVQDKLNPGRIQRILRQLGISPGDV